MIDESENRKLKTGRTDRLQERRNNWRQNRLVGKSMGWYLHGKADANMYGPPRQQGMDMERRNK